MIKDINKRIANELTLMLAAFNSTSKEKTNVIQFKSYVDQTFALDNFLGFFNGFKYVETSQSGKSRRWVFHSCNLIENQSNLTIRIFWE